jgi:peptidyl-tRNA hydrolase
MEDAENTMKMYICIKQDTPTGMAMNAAAHAGLMCHLEFNGKANYIEWLTKSFKKVTCAVTDAEFAMLKELPDTVIVTESRMANAELAIVLCPRQANEWPKFVNLLKLWK